MAENKIRAKINEAKREKEVSLPPSFRERHSCLIILILLVLIALYTFASQVIFAVPLFLYVTWFGFDIFLLNIQGFVTALESRSWPKAEAIVMRAVASESLFKEHNRSSWSLSLEYRYAVKGEEYVSNKYALVYRDYRKKEKVDALIEKLGDSFMVRYNPKKHAEAIVKVEVSEIYFIGMAMGILVMGGGALGLLDYFAVLDVHEMVKQWR